MKEKKGDMTIGTLIAIILGLVVLVLLIVGFTGGWNNFMDKLNFFGGTEDNISDKEIFCQQACTLSSKSDYCYEPLNLVWSDGAVSNEILYCINISGTTSVEVKLKNGSIIDRTISFIDCPTITC
jgi:hypothetical protein